ncbi:uncharacterized protein AB675_2143 [Cyphellophora attinorum]|uniref:Uncharacterized protein n=1 Tax=Cyphellophora attinorum TaxID=1664694 RepID=A0A0N0NPP6_9EURO|nr:uncharacterized protein AB675_2143 [Phialophora attinorum]KPI42789.1 hypothetical protein AB675_2143 [Phialophora attinorum]
MNSSKGDGPTEEQPAKPRKSAPPTVRRRSSKQASSKDRNGMVFERSNGRTIRAVTPERSNSAVSARPDNARSTQVGQFRDHSGSFSTTDDENLNTIDSRGRRARTASGPRKKPLRTLRQGHCYPRQGNASAQSRQVQR